MFELNLPFFDANIQKENEHTLIFDILRRRYVALTPEEWVRQSFIHFLIEHKDYPRTRLANEMAIELNGMDRRCDSILFGKDGKPVMIIEYKAPSVKISQKVFSQIWSYNVVLHVPYLIISNGMEHYCCHMNYETQQAEFLKEIPNYKNLTF